jgi:hypothetical protein
MLAALVLPRYGAGELQLLALALKVLAQVLLLPVVVRLVCNHALFCAIGTMLGPDWLAQVAAERRVAGRTGLFPALAVLALAATFMALPRCGGEVDFAAASSPVLSQITWRFPALGAAVACTIACIALASLRGLAVNPLLSALGRLTMPIFVLHVMIVPGTRIALMRLAHIDNPVGARSVAGAGGAGRAADRRAHAATAWTQSHTGVLNGRLRYHPQRQVPAGGAHWRAQGCGRTGGGARRVDRGHRRAALVGAGSRGRHGARFCPATCRAAAWADVRHPLGADQTAALKGAGHAAQPVQHRPGAKLRYGDDDPRYASIAFA